MNAAFTICAKNYLARAITLGDSLKEVHPEIPFYIFLSDEAEEMIDLSSIRYPVIEAKGLKIPQFRWMAFYYSVLELSCAIKPFCFMYLYDLYKYEKLIYFDPDIYLYNSAEQVLDALDEKLVVVTPHVTEISLTAEAAVPDASFLFVGAYNLGFIAIKGCPESIKIMSWWAERLVDQGFADFRDAQHVDQKWIDLLPGLLGEKLLILRDPGFNVAQWNIHERVLSVDKGKYLINSRPLIFYHHTSFNPHEPQKMAQRQTKYTLENRPEFTEMMYAYGKKLIENDYDKYISLPYAFSRFNNGINIFVFQRRILRTILKSRSISTDPFEIGQGSYFELLKQNRLIIYDRTKNEFVQADFKTANRNLRWFKKGLRLLKNLIGIKYYYLILRWLQNNSRPEEQIFLITKGIADLK